MGSPTRLVRGLSLKEFYLMMLREFANGEPLPYRFKTKYKQGVTKTFPQYDDNKYWTPNQYIKMIKDIKEWQDLINGENKRRKKTLR